MGKTCASSVNLSMAVSLKTWVRADVSSVTYYYSWTVASALYCCLNMMAFCIYWPPWEADSTQELGYEVPGTVSQDRHFWEKKEYQSLSKGEGGWGRVDASRSIANRKKIVSRGMFYLLRAFKRNSLCLYHRLIYYTDLRTTIIWFSFC